MVLRQEQRAYSIRSGFERSPNNPIHHRYYELVPRFSHPVLRTMAQWEIDGTVPADFNGQKPYIYAKYIGLDYARQEFLKAATNLGLRNISTMEELIQRVKMIDECPDTLKDIAQIGAILRMYANEFVSVRRVMETTGVTRKLGKGEIEYLATSVNQQQVAFPDLPGLSKRLLNGNDSSSVDDQSVLYYVNQLSLPHTFISGGKFVGYRDLALEFCGYKEGIVAEMMEHHLTGKPVIYRPGNYNGDEK